MTWPKVTRTGRKKTSPLVTNPFEVDDDDDNSDDDVESYPDHISLEGSVMSNLSRESKISDHFNRKRDVENGRLNGGTAPKIKAAAANNTNLGAAMGAGRNGKGKANGRVNSGANNNNNGGGLLSRISALWSGRKNAVSMTSSRSAKTRRNMIIGVVVVVVLIGVVVGGVLGGMKKKPSEPEATNTPTTAPVVPVLYSSRERALLEVFHEVSVDDLVDTPGTPQYEARE